MDDLNVANVLSEAVASVLLDQIPESMFICNDDGRLRWMNLAAQRTVAAARHLQLTDKHLTAPSAEDQAALRRAIVNACSRGLRALLSIGGANDRVFALVMPLPAPNGAGSTYAAILCGRNQVCQDLSIEMLSNLHELTSSERRVLAALLAGQRPIAVAEANGVEVSTIRTQVGMIRAKLGVGSIGDLTRLAARLPSVMAMRCETPFATR